MILTRLYTWFVDLNLFEDDTSLINRNDQLITTRLFIILLNISCIIVALFASLALQTQSVTVESPSVGQFEYLNDVYEKTLVCPCSQTNVRYDQFLSFDPRYHQVCSSEFVSQEFISSLFSVNMTRYYPLDFRLMAMSQFQVLSLLCRTVASTINDALNRLLAQQITTSYVLTRQVFDAQVAAIVEQMQRTTVADVKHIDELVSLIVSQSQIMTALNTNVYLVEPITSTKFGIQLGLYPLTNYSLTNLNNTTVTTCNCQSTPSCTFQAGFYSNLTRPPMGAPTLYQPISPPLFIVPGMLVGCMPRDSMLQSTLECFYNRSCLDLIGVSQNITALIPTTSSHFSTDATVGFIFDQLFIETWQNSSDFGDYYNACVPQLCSYTYTQRNSFLFAMTTLLSLIGGLTTILGFITPYIVRCFRHLQQKCRDNKTASSSDSENPIRSIEDRVVILARRIHHMISTFNIFDSSFSTINLGVRTTRLYICFLFTGALILFSYSLFSVTTISVTIDKPTLSTFEEIYSRHSSTLVCPCTSLSMTYDKILTVTPHYHQLCSSDFVRNDRWLLYFDITGLNNSAGFFYSLYSADFRGGIGMSLFLLIQTLCEAANATVVNAATAFGATELVSAYPMARDSFQNKTTVLSNQFQQETQASFLTLFSQVSTAVRDNQLYSAVNPQANLAVNASLKYVRIRLRNIDPAESNCSCAMSTNCTRPQGFYCSSSSCHNIKTIPNMRVPGMYMGCSLIDSLRYSRLDCLFNQSCIQLMLDWRLFDINNSPAPIDPRGANTTALNLNLSSRYLSNSTFELLVLNMFIENWTFSNDFHSYFTNCNPTSCTYTYEQQYALIATITFLIGLLGGLSVALRLILPPCVKLIVNVAHRCSRDDETRMQLVECSRRCRLFLLQIWKQLLTVDVFKSNPLFNQNNEMVGASRLYIILLCLTLGIVIFFISFGQQTHTVTVRSPSESTFSNLHDQQIASLSCPCSQSVIEYKTFLSITPRIHQVCSSGFVTANWWSYLWAQDAVSNFLDLQLLSAQFRLLASLCSLTQQSIDGNINQFYATELITVETLLLNSFQSQVDSLFNTFTMQTPKTFHRSQSLIHGVFRSNQLMNAFATTWQLSFTNAAENDILATVPRPSFGTDYPCVTSLNGSWRPLYIDQYYNATVLPGVVAGCLPIDGTRLSTLECFFDSNCIRNLTTIASTRQTNIWIPDPLNASAPSIFALNTQVGALVDALFVEAWVNASNYSSYFASCAPHSCSYNYVRRNTVLYIITAVLGFYGGLTVVLRFSVWHGWIVYRKITTWIRLASRSTSTRVAPYS